MTKPPRLLDQAFNIVELPCREKILLIRVLPAPIPPLIPTNIGATLLIDQIKTIIAIG